MCGARCVYMHMSEMTADRMQSLEAGEGPTGRRSIRKCLEPNTRDATVLAEVTVLIS